jgi:hypothetical protein
VFLLVILLCGCCVWYNRRQKEHFQTGNGTFGSPYMFDDSSTITLDVVGNYVIIVDGQPALSADDFPQNTKFIKIPREITNVGNYIKLGDSALITGVNITGYSGHITPDNPRMELKVR